MYVKYQFEGAKWHQLILGYIFYLILYDPLEFSTGNCPTPSGTEMVILHQCAVCPSQLLSLDGGRVSETLSNAFIAHCDSCQYSLHLQCNTYELWPWKWWSYCSIVSNHLINTEDLRYFRLLQFLNTLGFCNLRWPLHFDIFLMQAVIKK